MNGPDPAAILAGARGAATLVRAGTGARPDRVGRSLLAALRHPPGLLAGLAASAARHPDAVAVAAGEERVTYAVLWDESAAIAAGLARAGVGADFTVAILYRNSAMYLRLILALAMLGADQLFLNTGLGPEQLAATVASEGVDLTLREDHYDHVPVDTPLIATAELEQMMREPRGGHLPRPARQSRMIILTSGTTGRPRGAARPSGAGGSAGAAGAALGLLGRVPLHPGDTMVIPAPWFHGWGLGMVLAGLALSATIVTGPEFDAERTLAAVSDWRARVLVVVPAMLARICALAPERLAQADTTELAIIASSGSAIPRRLVIETLDRFGPVLYNLYGSTEVAIAAVAGPVDLRADPTTAGRVAPGVSLAVLDAQSRPVAPGEVGRIFVGGPARFEGYTEGGSRESVDGMLGTGDVGHLDRRGRLFVAGREDDMIVSGAENVYPREVEDLLCAHPAVAEAVVVGVPDERFGQALKAFVVLRADTDVEAETLKRYVAQHAARFKVPRAFVFLESLPRNATGKILRRELT